MGGSTQELHLFLFVVFSMFVVASTGALPPPPPNLPYCSPGNDSMCQDYSSCNDVGYGYRCYCLFRFSFNESTETCEASAKCPVDVCSHACSYEFDQAVCYCPRGLELDPEKPLRCRERPRTVYWRFRLDYDYVEDFLNNMTDALLEEVTESLQGGKIELQENGTVQALLFGEEEGQPYFVLGIPIISESADAEAYHIYNRYFLEAQLIDVIIE